MAECDEAPEDEGDDEGPAIEAEMDDPQSGDRMMIETLSTLVSSRYDEPFANDGVQVSYERMMIAAMDRIARICRNDLPTDQP